MGTHKENVGEATRFIKTMRRTGTRAQRIILANAVTFRELCRFIKSIERTPTITELRLNYQFTRQAIERDQNWRENVEKDLRRVAERTLSTDNYVRTMTSMLESQVRGPAQVLVVSADFGLNGHEVIGVFIEYPSEEQMAGWTERFSEVTGFAGIEVEEHPVVGA